ncbi:hypothetical protein IGI39_003349 [Enterococcus sp. AZ135]|uniref:4-hydroxy-3-methylbut-2-enyl diphosphate reductase n=1 Tax=unclassified Enterococcus TaxID=2608891 RepID=UPI003F27D4D4
MILKLWEYVNETVKLELLNGKIIKGRVRFWNDEEDTEDGEDEIVIGHEVYGISQIKSIELIE